jgi:hypothetical protein
MSFPDCFTAHAAGTLPQLASLTEVQRRQSVFNTSLHWVVKNISPYNPALPADTLFES